MDSRESRKSWVEGPSCENKRAFFVEFWDLLPDTKPAKYAPQQILGANLPRYSAQVMQGLADVHGNEIAGELGLQS